MAGSSAHIILEKKFRWHDEFWSSRFTERWAENRLWLDRRKSFLYCVLGQQGDVVDVELVHYPKLVRLGCLWAYGQIVCQLFDALALGQELKHFPLPLRNTRDSHRFYG
jgi:hypothetical protein